MNNDNLNAIKSQLKTLSEAELHGIISGALLEIKTRAYHEGVEFGSGMADLVEQHHETLVGLANRKSDQEIRDEIIEKAKRDVAELGVEAMHSNRLKYLVDYYGTYADFIVNKEKRTVVVLMRGMGTRKIYAKGIAKCAPSDCFNSHLGRAISLRRALGLEVPTEYLSAPQPTEVRVGDVVRWEHVDCNYEVLSLENKWNNVLGYGADGTRFEACGGNFYYHGLKIIDDSREGGEE